MTDQKKAKIKTPLSSRFRGYLPVVLDIETAGFKAETAAISEVGAGAISAGTAATETGSVNVGNTG